MRIHANDPTQPLDKFHDWKHMTNPYGTFKTKVPEKEAQINSYVEKLNDKFNMPTNYSQSLLKQAYSNIHPRQGVTETLNYQIRNMKRQQIERYANESGMILKQIKDYNPGTLTPENIWNLPNIAKYHEYFTDHQGRAHISPDEWLDLKGKSDQHIKWDAQFWEDKSIGDQNNKAQKRHTADFQHEMYWYNYHANKYNNIRYNPHLTSREKYIQGNYQLNYMDEWLTKFNHNYQKSGKSWLSKMYMAKGWITYHQNELNNMLTYWVFYPYNHKPNVKYEQNEISKWKKKLTDYTNHKNGDYHYYQEYENEYRQRMYHEMMERHWAEINSQVSANQSNNLTSIYCADGMDTRVVAVAELTPTEEEGFNVPTKPIDDGMPQNDWTQVNNEQLSGNYTIYLPLNRSISEQDMNYGDASPSYNQRVATYNILKGWAEGQGHGGRVLSIRGFNDWRSILITDLQRSGDTNSSANGLQLQLTFQYARLAHIKYAKNTKAPSRPIRGRSQKSRTIKVKKYDTYWGLSHKYGGTISAWEHANPHSMARDLQIGSHLHVPSGARI